MSRARQYFEASIAECDEAIAVHEYLLRSSNFKADFSLRFVWIAAVSSLDHYITEKIIEETVVAYADGRQLQPKLNSEPSNFASLLPMRGASAADAILCFRAAVSNVVRFKSFHRASQVADGLAFIWDEQHKWQILAACMGLDVQQAKNQLDAIVDRRNLIAHNADIDEASGARMVVQLEDAKSVVGYVKSLVDCIDRTI